MKKLSTRNLISKKIQITDNIQNTTAPARLKMYNESLGKVNKELKERGAEITDSEVQERIKKMRTL